MPLNVLFLCTGNSCRSIMAEALLNHIGAGRFAAMSAGSKPSGVVHPKSLELLAAKGIPAQGYRSKSWDELGETPFDIAITVCDNAAGEACPVFPGAPVKAHWGVPDPAHAKGTDAEIMAAFENSFALLQARIRAMTALPLEAMDAKERAAKLLEIGENNHG